MVLLLCRLRPPGIGSLVIHRCTEGAGVVFLTLCLTFPITKALIPQLPPTPCSCKTVTLWKPESITRTQSVDGGDHRKNIKVTKMLIGGSFKRLQVSTQVHWSFESCYKKWFSADHTKFWIRTPNPDVKDCSSSFLLRIVLGCLAFSILRQVHLEG